MYVSECPRISPENFTIEINNTLLPFSTSLFTKNNQNKRVLLPINFMILIENLFLLNNCLLDN